MICFRKMERLKEKDLKLFVKSKSFEYQKGKAELDKMTLADLKNYKGEVEKYLAAKQKFVKSSNLPNSIKKLYTSYFTIITQHLNLVKGIIFDASEKQNKAKGSEKKACESKKAKELPKLNKQLAGMKKLETKLIKKRNDCIKTKCGKEKEKTNDKKLEDHQKRMAKIEAQINKKCGFQPNLKF